MSIATTYAQSLAIGCNVDWCKTAPGRRAYHKAKREGINVPQRFRDRGFDHVRIRIRDYDLVSVNPGTGKTLLEEIEIVVLDCLMAGLSPIVAFQGEGFKLAPSQASIDAVIHWWKTIANHFKAFDGKLTYNLIIETTDAVKDDDAILNELYRQCASAIRVMDADRVLIVCPNCISAPEKLNDLVVPEGNCFAESHFYAAGPSPTNSKKQWTNGTGYEKQLIYNKIALMTDWRSATGNSVWLGAIMFGDFNSDDGDDLACSYTPQGQAEFAAFVCGALKAKNIPFAINSDTKFYDRDLNEWREEQSIVLDAVFGT
jgi:hypothetical protein